MRVSDPFEDLDVRQRTRVLIAVCTVLGAVLFALLFPTAAGVVAFLAGIFTIIMLHEFGHFVAAKRSGMKVTEYFVGFGPRLWSFRRGETEYGVKAVPLGGYCKIIGMTNLEEVASEDEPRAYRSKKWGPKVVVAGAGPAVHFIIALFLMFGVIYFSGDYRNEKITTSLGRVAQGAQAAGLRAGDTVIAINGVAVEDWEKQVPNLINPKDHPAKAGDDVRIVVRRGDEVFERTVTLQDAEDDNGKVLRDANGNTRAVAGISPSIYVPHPGFFAAVAESPRQVVAYAGDSVKALGTVFSPSGMANYFRLLTGDTSKNTNQQNRFISPVGAVSLGADAVRAGWVSVIELLLAICVFTGLFNLLPLLPFDGGHIAVATYERIMSAIRHRRVQVDMARLMPITVAVLAVMGFILISSIYLDIANPIKNPF